MKFFDRLKLYQKNKAKKQSKKTAEKVALQFMLNFAEGRITTDEFWKRYRNDDILQKKLINDKTRQKGYTKYDSSAKSFMVYKKLPNDINFPFSPERLLNDIDINNLYHRYELFLAVRAYFWRRKENVNYKNKDAEEYEYLREMLPQWLDIRDTLYLSKILDLAPNDLSKTQKIQWCKTKIKELFRYDKKPPEWNQSPEWPIIDGKPLAFNKQIDDPEINGRTLYYFYNEETKVETVVEQFD